MPGMDQLWQQKMLELGGEPLLALMKEIRDTQQQQAGQLANVERGISDLIRGFPAGDVDGHRRYHESVIEWRELRNQVMRAALEKVAQAGAIAAFGYIMLALWEWFKVEVKK